MTFKLKELPYPMDALEPVISKKTVEFHYTKHHQGYVDKLNKFTAGTEFEHSTLEEIIKKSKDSSIFNNGAQVWNHTFYWESLSPNSEKIISGILLEKITKYIGTAEAFKDKFLAQAAGLFGSGWAWLVENPDGSLEIEQRSNADNPMKDGKVPLLTIDVWEHAYYLDYQNKRPEYLEKIWDLIDWKKVELRLEYHDVTGRKK